MQIFPVPQAKCGQHYKSDFYRAKFIADREVCNIGLCYFRKLKNSKCVMSTSTYPHIEAGHELVLHPIYCVGMVWLVLLKSFSGRLEGDTFRIILMRFLFLSTTFPVRRYSRFPSARPAKPRRKLSTLHANWVQLGFLIISLFHIGQ